MWCKRGIAGEATKGSRGGERLMGFLGKAEAGGGDLGRVRRDTPPPVRESAKPKIRFCEFSICPLRSTRQNVGLFSSTPPTLSHPGGCRCRKQTWVSGAINRRCVDSNDYRSAPRSVLNDRYNLRFLNKVRSGPPLSVRTNCVRLPASARPG